jgi:hypothetical protein
LTLQQASRLHRLLVDTNVIDQAGPETAGLKTSAGTNVQAAIGGYPDEVPRILCNLYSIDIQMATRTIPDQANLVPFAISNYGLGLQWGLGKH